MPMGITADIYDGKDVTLRDYLMRVGRGMGFAIMQRDDAWDAPVRHVEPSSYYADAVEKATARVDELRAMTPEQIAAAAEADYIERHARWVEGRDTKLALRARYEAMLAEVEAWEPDPLMESTKEQAIKYLRESIDFDCGKAGEEMAFRPEPIRVAPEQWHTEQTVEAEMALARAIKSNAEELERVAERNRYIDAFYASLPPAQETATA